MALLSWLKPTREPEARRAAAPTARPPRRLTTPLAPPPAASAAPAVPSPAPTRRADGAPLRPRAPRYRVSLPAVVSGPHGNAFMLACSVSEGGCGLAWNGPAPRLGGGLHLKLGTGSRAVPLRAAVCWAREAPRGLRVGLRFLESGNAATQAALAALVAEARRIGQAE